MVNNHSKKNISYFTNTPKIFHYFTLLLKFVTLKHIIYLLKKLSHSNTNKEICDYIIRSLIIICRN